MKPYRPPLFDCVAIRHPATRKLWWHRLVSLGRVQRVIDTGFAVEFYRTRKGAHVILDTQETEDSPFYGEEEKGGAS